MTATTKINLLTDNPIRHELQNRLGASVVIWSRENADRPTVVEAALVDPLGASIKGKEDGQAQIALVLADHTVALWETLQESSQTSLSHARTIVDLLQTSDQRDQLLAEAEALATQVVNDFEELSLIRSLASAMELPSSGIDLKALCDRTLVPLAEGIGAVSIASVFLDEAGDVNSLWWSGEPQTENEVLLQLIEEHRKEASIQPIVRNETNALNPMIDAGQLGEFILVQCRSEGRLHGWLVACNRLPDATDDVPWAQLGFTTVQASLLDTATNQLAAQIHNARLLRQKEELFTDVVRALVNAVEARDPYTCGHSERVAAFAKCLAGLTGENQSACDRIYLTGLLHDVGKIAIPDGVLQKPGHLDDDERAIIQTHTDAGWRILQELDALKEVLPGVLYHHEHFDGKGYPDGLIGDAIPLDGRILAVCDAFDAMTSDRPYRQGMPLEQAVSILRGGSGSDWDPRLIEVFCNNIDRIAEIRRDHKPRQHAVRPAPVNGQPVMTPIMNAPTILR